MDEIQRIPALLNEVQYLISEYDKVQFILTGSSARKLKRGSANMLGGRALVKHLYPLTTKELGKDFDLDEVLRYGSLPSILLSKNKTDKQDSLHSYVHSYLKEEIKAEGIVRNFSAFSRFLDLATAEFSHLVSYSSIARDCGVSEHTIKSYYEILEDTLIGLKLEPWNKSIRKRLVKQHKFYLFDTGVTNAINRLLSSTFEQSYYGRLYEQFVILEVFRHLQYHSQESSIYFWCTNHGAEVDLLIEKHGKIQAAIEIKSSATIKSAHFSGLRAFQEEYPQVPLFILAPVTEPYAENAVSILNLDTLLESLDL